MKYILFVYENEKYWIELDNDSFAVRQIILDENKVYHISCFEDCLAEGKIDLTELEGEIKKITESEFSFIWNEIIGKYSEVWEKTKRKYQIGKFITGKCKCYYPHGCIIKGKDFIAIYKGEKHVGLHEQVYVKIVAYDDINMWIVTE